MNQFESAEFDALNSEELTAKTLRQIKIRLAMRIENAKKYKNPNKLPTDKDVKAAAKGEEGKIDAVIDATTKYWQEQAFNAGYLKALQEIDSDLQKVGL